MKLTIRQECKCGASIEVSINALGVRDIDDIPWLIHFQRVHDLACLNVEQKKDES